MFLKSYNYEGNKNKRQVFSSSQLAVSVVPIREFAHTKANTIIKANSQMFFLNGTLSFDIAIVKLIDNIFLVVKFKYTE
jgi:hypothetical protein